MSIRARIIRFLLSYMKYLQSKKERIDYFDYDISIPDLRKSTDERASRFGKVPKDFTCEQTIIQNVKAEWIIPPNPNKEKVILYFHGGTYIIGSIKGHRAIVSKFVQESSIKALLFEYRLAPENPFPAALDDSVKIYKHLLNEKSAADIIFIGDSSGGGLCLATLLALKEQQIQLPSKVVVLSPWTDLSCSGKSLKENYKIDKISWKNSWNVCSDYYRNGHDAQDPLVSPLFGDLTNLPPMQIYVGGDETLRDDSIRFAQKVNESGGNAELTVGKGLFHCYPALAPLFPEANKAMSEIAIFVTS